MTQKDLAAKLHVTDKAVSKWERGLSCPDISLLSPLAELLGVTTGELLNGEKSPAVPEVETAIGHVLQYAEKAEKGRAKSIQSLCAAAFSVLLLVGIAVCAICDLAISGNFTWSLFPISSIVFAWLVFFPIIRFGEKGILAALALLTLFIVPFLFVLNRLVGTGDFILTIGVRMAFLSLLFLWIVFALFKKWSTRKLIASAVSLLLAVPLSAAINFSLNKLISEPVVDVWDLLTCSILIILAGVLFAADYRARKKKAF